MERGVGERAEGEREPSRHAAITGASGFIGGALERHLRSRGDVTLRGLFRTAGAALDRWREGGHEVVEGDLSDPDALARLVDGADVVYHLAAFGGKRDAERSHEVNVVGTQRVARAAREAGVGRLVYVSSISVYAATERRPETITESLEPQGIDELNPYSASKYRGELALRALRGRDEAPPFTILRPTNVYGPGGRAWVTDWVRRLRRLRVVPGGDIPIDVVHVDDVARALADAALVPAAEGETLHIGHTSILLTEYAIRLGAALGWRIHRLPAPLDRLVRHAREAAWRRLHGNRISLPLTRPALYPHDRAARVIGYRPRIDLADGLAEVVRWVRDEAPELLG
ncbi:MAG: NAD-dependent epimerase/dehydratase family protein [Longimicrobiales bacterium]|nr:NAD-dependent epimerase/dehydratase family protein [Longimicrobiales bacterium]